MRPTMVIMGLAAILAVPAADRPNLVFILADDLGYGDVHCLNPDRGRIATPNLDRLAGQGMRFTDAHGGSSVCTPTRYGLLTGRYAWRSHLQHGVLDGYVEPLIPAQRLTLPAMLHQQGYDTACIGKWHLGFTVDHDGRKKRKGLTAGEDAGAEGGEGKGGWFTGAPLGARTTDGPVTRGFDHFFGFHHARMMESVFEDDRVTSLVPPVAMLPTLVKRTTAYLTRQAATGKPFFLYFALNAPHTPIVPSPEWQGRSGLGDYGDFVMETDWAVGEVLAALDQAGVAGRTLVVVASDNGCSPAAGTSKLEKQGHFSSGPFRGHKADIWDGGHRIPCLVRWPGTVAAGSVCTTTICLTDVMATMAAITGATLPADAAEDSFSFLPDLDGSGHSARAAIVHHSINGRFAIRQGPWKLELCPGSGGWGSPKDAEAAKRELPPIQLYDMAKDLGETTNVQAGNADVVQRLTALLERTVDDGRSTPGPAQRNDVAVDITATGRAGGKAKGDP